MISGPIRRRLGGSIGWVAALLALGGCQGAHHVLDPQGPQARHIASLWWLMQAVGALVFLAVTVAVLLAFWRRRRTAQAGVPHPADPEAIAGDGPRSFIVVSAVGVTAVILVVLVILSVRTGRQLAALGPTPALTIEVIGHQWWWEVRYLDPVASNIIVSANEVRLPVGEPVRLLLRSADVIHSFWVPNLQGKMDLIPGRENVLWLQADTVGEWKGFCAEFCGLQHAKMAMVVVALPPGEFQAWAARERLPAAPPADELAAEGLRVFEEGTCATCHSIRGTRAHGKVAPDLTHLASRRMLASGILPNTRGHLAGWILDPQAIKPGAFMPGTDLDPARLHALLHWLESLR